MYNNVQENLFEGLLTAALNEFVAEELALTPSDEELAKTYPTSQKMLKYYRRKAKEKKLNSPLPLVYLKRAAIIMLITVSVAFGILLTSEDVRAAIAETFIAWHETFVVMDFTKLSEQANKDNDGETTEQVLDVRKFEIDYIPSDFILDSVVSEDRVSREYIYMSENGDYIFLGIYISEYTEFLADTELSTYESIQLNNNDAYLFYNDAERYASVILYDSNYCVIITGTMEKNEAIKIAENIK